MKKYLLVLLANLLLTEHVPAQHKVPKPEHASLTWPIQIRYSEDSLFTTALLIHVFYDKKASRVDSVSLESHDAWYQPSINASMLADIKKTAQQKVAYFSKASASSPTAKVELLIPVVSQNAMLRTTNPKALEKLLKEILFPLFNDLGYLPPGKLLLEPVWIYWLKPKH